MMKILKPIDYDISYKYVCPNTKCNASHWLFLRETQTKGFRVVCECGTIFRIKRISKVKTIYKKLKNKVTTNPKKQQIPLDLQTKCVKILVGYGFTDSEAISMVNRAFEKNLTNNAGLLVKYILQNLETLNVSN